MLILGSTVNYNRSQITFDITSTLTNCTSNNLSTSIHLDDTYTATITADSGYTLTGASISITMGSVDITSTAYNNGIISIQKVTGDININISAAEIIFTVTNNLTNCVSDNASTSVHFGDSYIANITANTDYTLVGATILITMGGTDITSTAYNNGVITIASVTDNLIINIAAKSDQIEPLPASYFNFYSDSSITGIGVSGLSTAGRTAYNNGQITSLILPDKDAQGRTVVAIGWSAFKNLTNITSVIIPNSITTILSNAFEGCTGLTSIVIPRYVTSISECVFANCPNLVSIMVDQNNPTYDSRDNCNCIVHTQYNFIVQGCKTSTIPNTITSIGRSAFKYCAGLTSITIPTSVKSIGEDAFASSDLTSITIPNSITSIDYDAFNSCTHLISATLENGITVMGFGMFKYCTSLTTVTIPNSITKIQDDAFTGCTSLSNISIPNSVTSIGYGAFYGCTRLTSITIPNSVTTIESNAFYQTGLTSINISNSVTSIGDYAFYYCTNATSVTIGSGIRNIYDKAFSNCAQLASITITATTPPTLGYGSTGSGSGSGYSVFDNTNNCPIYVPSNSVSAYKSAEEWSIYSSRIQAIPA